MAGSTSGDSLKGGVHLNLSEVKKVRSLLSKLEKPSGNLFFNASRYFSIIFFIWQLHFRLDLMSQVYPLNNTGY